MLAPDNMSDSTTLHCLFQTCLTVCLKCSHLQASSLQFLAKAGFDFNRFVYGGVPYMHLSSLVSQRAALGKEAAAGRQQLAAALQDEALAAHIAQVRVLFTSPGASSHSSSGETELVMLQASPGARSNYGACMQ